MQWRKELGSSLQQSYDKILVFSLILLFISLVFNRSSAFIMIGAVAAFILMSLLYDRWIGRALTFENKKHVYRLFPGDHLDVPLAFHNQSLLPIVNGHFHFKLGTEVEGRQYKDTGDEEWNSYTVPLTVVQRGETVISLPVQAKQRGVTRFREISYRFPHLLNFHSVYLYFHPFHKVEFVVYPEPLPVYGIEGRYQMTMGSQQTRLSPFEDPLSPVGTREYTNQDPFHKIHWKASARKQTLQTKVLEKNWDNTWSFVVNITRESKGGYVYVTPEVENVLSYVTYMCQLATKKGYPFELYINARKTGSPPFYALPEGTGKEHLQRALELIARIKVRELVLPYAVVLHRFDQQMYKPKTVFMFGDQNQETLPYIHKWRTNRITLYSVVNQGEFAVLADPLEGGGLYEKLK